MYLNKKTLLMIISVVVFALTIGFALLSQNLNITGTAQIGSNFDIRITNIRVKNLHSGYQSGTNAAADVSGNSGCTVNNISGCTGTIASFEASLKTPGDYIVYEVTITNSGTLDGVVSSVNLNCTQNSAITCTTTGLSQGDKIVKTQGTNTVDVKIEYNSNTSTQPVNTSVSATLIINYQQDLTVQETPSLPEEPEEIKTYEVYRGLSDKVTELADVAVGDYIFDYDKEITDSPKDLGNAYIKHEVSKDDDTVVANYVCLVTDQEYCIIAGEVDSDTGINPYYSVNKAVILANDTWFEDNMSGVCFYDEEDDKFAACHAYGFPWLMVNSDGSVISQANKFYWGEEIEISCYAKTSSSSCELLSKD